MKQPLGRCEKRSGMTLPLMLRGNRQVVEPAAMSLITCHDGGNNLAIKHPYQKEIGPHGPFALNILLRGIPGTNQVTASPKQDDRLFVLRLKGPDLHG